MKEIVSSLMKKLFLILGIFTLGGTAARADITHRMQSSVSLSTAAAATQVERVGSTYSISGTGIDTSWQKFGSTGTNDVTAHGIGGLDYQTTTTNNVTTQNTTSSLGSLTASQQTTTTCTAGCDGDNPTNVTTANGTAFSLTQSYTPGDTVSSTAPSVGAVSNYSTQVSTATGTGTGTGTIKSGHQMTVVGGGSGTTSIGQFVTELNIK